MECMVSFISPIDESSLMRCWRGYFVNCDDSFLRSCDTQARILKTRKNFVLKSVVREFHSTVTQSRTQYVTQMPEIVFTKNEQKNTSVKKWSEWMENMLNGTVGIPPSLQPYLQCSARSFSRPSNNGTSVSKKTIATVNLVHRIIVARR